MINRKVAIMRNVQTLLARAREKFHTDEALAERMGVKKSEISDIRRGARPMSPETALILCDVAGITGQEAMEWMAVAIEQNPKNAERLPLLRRVLYGMGCALFALGLNGVATPTDAATLDARPELYRSVYYVNQLRRIRRAFRHLFETMRPASMRASFGG